MTPEERRKQDAEAWRARTTPTEDITPENAASYGYNSYEVQPSKRTGFKGADRLLDSVFGRSSDEPVTIQGEDRAPEDAAPAPKKELPVTVVGMDPHEYYRDDPEKRLAMVNEELGWQQEQVDRTREIPDDLKEPKRIYGIPEPRERTPVQKFDPIETKFEKIQVPEKVPVDPPYAGNMGDLRMKEDADAREERLRAVDPRITRHMKTGDWKTGSPSAAPARPAAVASRAPDDDEEGGGVQSPVPAHIQRIEDAAAGRIKSPLVAEYLKSKAQAAPDTAKPDTELTDAQDLAARRRAGARIARGVAKIGASIGRGNIDEGYWNGLVDDADRPVKELQAQRDSATKKAAAAREDVKFQQDQTRFQREGELFDRGTEEYQSKAALRDPNSRQSRVARAQLLTTHPDLAGRIPRAELEGASAEDVKAMQDAFDEATKAGIDRDKAAEIARHNKASEAIDWAKVRVEKDKAANESARDRRGMQLDTIKFGEQAEAKNRLNTNLNRMRELAFEAKPGVDGKRHFKADIPGAGRIDSANWVPDEFKSDDDFKMRQAADGAVADLVLMMSGRAATDAERAALKRAYGLSEGGSETAFKQGLAKFIEDADLASKGLQARYRPEVLEQFRARGGVLPEDTAQAPGAPGAPQAPQGPGKTLVGGTDNGDGTVTLRYSDGTSVTQRKNG